VDEVVVMGLHICQHEAGEDWGPKATKLRAMARFQAALGLLDVEGCCGVVPPPLVVTKPVGVGSEVAW